MKVCAFARLFGQAGCGNPEDFRVGNRCGVKFFRVDHQIGGNRVAVKVEREIIGGKNFAQHNRGFHSLYGGRVLSADIQALELLTNKHTQRVTPGAGDHGAGASVPGSSDSDVGGASAEELPEAGDFFQSNALLKWVQVDPGATHGQHIESGRDSVHREKSAFVMAKAYFVLTNYSTRA